MVALVCKCGHEATEAEWVAIFGPRDAVGGIRSAEFTCGSCAADGIPRASLELEGAIEFITLECEVLV